MSTAFRPKSFLIAVLAGASLSALAPAVADAQVDAWVTKAQPYATRSAGYAAIKLYNGKVLIAAGNAGDGTTDTYEIFDPAGDEGHGSFTRHQGMNGSHYANFNHYWHGEFLDLGGPHHKVMLVAENTESPYSEGPITSQIYDPVDDTWSTAVNTGMPTAAIFDCARSGNGTIACYPQAGWMFPEGLQVYDPATDSWSAHGYPQNNGGEWVANHVLRPSITGLEDGKFLTVSSNYCCQWNNSATFDSSTNTWEDSGDLPGYMLGGGVTWRLSSGDVLMAGGMKNDRYGNDMSYLWNHTTGVWSEAGKITGNESVGATTELSGGTLDNDGNPIFVTANVLHAKFDVAAGHWDSNAFRVAQPGNYDDPVPTAPGAPITLDDGRTLVFGGGPVYAGRPQDRTWASKTYFYGNVPRPTSSPQVDKSILNFDETATVTSNATWDTPGITVDRRWKLCKRWSQCVDAGSDPSSASYTFTAADFAAGYDTMERVETYDDKSVGPQTTRRQVELQGPAAPAADPPPSVNFDPSGEYAAGAVLTRSQGTWTGHNLGPVTRKWQRCADGGSGWECVDLPDAATYTVTQADIDARAQIKYVESVTDDLSQTTTRDASGSIAPVSPPSVNCCLDLSFPSSNNSGNVPMGQTLTANAADINWNHTPDSVEYKWQRYDNNLGEWVDINGATGLTLSTAGFIPGDELQLVARGTKNGDTGEWSRVASISIDTNMWTPNGKFNWDTGNSRCTQTESLADLRTQGDCGDQISDARYYTSSRNHGDAYDGAYSTWIAKDSGNGDGTVYAQTLVDQGPNNELAWKKAGDFGTDWWTSGAFGSDDEIDGVKIGVRFRPSATLDLVAKVVKLTNTTSDPVTRVIAETLNFGSDSDTTIHGQSSGGSETLDPAARWFVTADSSVGDNEPSDPVNTTVFGGPDAAVSPTTGQSDDDLGATFEVTIPAGETRYLVYFMGLGSMLQPATNDPSVAVTNAQSLFVNYQSLPSDLLVDVPVGDRGKILNWSTVPPVVAPRVDFKGWANSVSGVAKLAVFGAPGAQIEVSNLANFKNSTSVGVGRWVSFKTLAKKLGAGQVRVYFREKGKPSSASSIDLKYDFYRPFISANSVRWAKTAKATWNVHILANDKTCPGCDPKLMVQLAYGKTKPAAADPFPTVLSRDVFSYRAYFTIKSPTPPRWVRVADSQGNMSDWRPLVGSPAFPAG